jgi:NADP-dependent 3-hydroxy acid dehydrogenase YdfG
MTRELAGKVAIITGGAGGIGKALGVEMAARGCAIVLADVNEELLEATAAELRGVGALVMSRVVDVRDADAVKGLVRDAHRDLGRIDYLFNNAGINVCAEIFDTSLEDWNRLIDVNLRGVVHGVHAALPVMREQGFGHIINTASAAGLIPAAAEGAYAATKHAVVGLSSALRVEAEASGVRVSVVCPGLVDTAILSSTKYVNLDARAIVDASPQKPIEPAKAAKLILRGVAKNDFYIVLTLTVHALWRVNRFMPNASLKLHRLAIERFRKARTD